MPLDPVIVVGGGWAGLACALTLTEAKVPLIVLEAAPQFGGRARGIRMGDYHVDNGQHLFIGAYRELRSLWDLLRVDTDSLFLKSKAHLLIKSKDKDLCLNFLSSTNPLKRFYALLRSPTLSLSDKLALMQFGIKLKSHSFHTDITVSEGLKLLKSPKHLNHMIWEPLCLAALTTPAQYASMQVFSRTLKDAFLSDNNTCEFWFAKKDLSEVFPVPALEYLQSKNAPCLTSHRVTKLHIEKGTCLSVSTDKNTFKARAVVLATPYHQSCKLLPFPLEPLDYEPITTVYLRMSKKVELEASMIGLIDCLGQWVFNRSFAEQPDLLAIVISGSGPHITMTHAELVQKIQHECLALWPQLGDVIDSKVVHEKRAAFSCRAGIQAMRPNTITALTNVFLAGDFCQTPYPSTLEGAIISGKQAALHILSGSKNHDDYQYPIFTKP